jgi:heme exporter protein B
MFSEVRTLLFKDLSLELRRMHHLNGLLLFVLGTVFLCFLSFNNKLDRENWNALFWIIQLFAAIQASGHSFSAEHSNRHIYYYSIASPVSVLLSKTIFNFCLLLITGFGSFFSFWLLLGLPSPTVLNFMLLIVVASFGFAAILTLVSAIAWRAGHSFSLMAILSFPVMYPFIIMMIKTSLFSLNNTSFSIMSGYYVVLFLISLLAIALGIILFPYLWKE